MPKYEIKVKAQHNLTICADDTADAEEQAIDHFHDFYEVTSVEILDLATGETTEGKEVSN